MFDWVGSSLRAPDGDALHDGLSSLTTKHASISEFRAVPLGVGYYCTVRDLDIDNDAVARWRPFHGKLTIVIDLQRAFGQPIAAEFGVPTVALADAVKAEGSIDRVAHLYEIPAAVVRDAMRFEEHLLAA